MALTNDQIRKEGEIVYARIMDMLRKSDDKIPTIGVVYAAYRLIHFAYKSAIDIHPHENFGVEYNDLRKNTNNLIEDLKDYKKRKDKEWAKNR